MNWFKQKRLQPTLVILLSSLILMLMLVEGIVLYSSTSDLLSEKVSEASLRELEQLNNGLEQHMRTIRSAALSIAINPDIIQMLSHSAELDAYTQLRNNEYATRILSNLTNSRNDITESYIITDRMNIYNYSNPNGLYNKERAITQAFWDNMKRENDGFIPPRDNDIRTDGSGGKIITYFRKLSMSNGTELGYMCINVNADRFLSSLSVHFPEASNRLYIVDSQAVMFALDGTDRADAFSSTLRESAALKDNGYERLNRDGKDYLGVYTSLNAFGWRIVEISPYEEVTDGISTVFNSLLFVLISCLIVAVIAALYFARSFTLPIKRLINQMKKVGQGDFNIELDTSYFNEIGELNHRFMLMSHRIEQLMSNIEQEQQQMRRAELKTLQSQINPHFLYNTLDAINWMAIKLKAHDISRMASNLGSYFRLSLNKGRELTTIQAEVEHLHAYIEIMYYRYSGRFDFQEQIEPEILDCMIPKIVLQPLVENCFVHGLADRKGAGLIRLTGRIDNDDLLFTVTDDGAGANAKALNIALQQHIDTKAGYGIHNVNQRIQLRYGTRYGLFYEPVLQGTNVILRLPYNRAMTEED
ncbi:cache domain-containing sensor histidine kinase [Paenibacillus luteus]|uniref:cache domain-containing sensor histidine kinase n=1 Tax=Paenibacillus luteus TaxID=2545753 RepID=UPI00114472E1|nr:sensor histidine kinase [Paenibacillus luteus]